MSDNHRTQQILSALGPGLLFAAAAVGVSHLVQATRAGAEFGVAMLGWILVANFTKYPSFRYAAEYSVATGSSLLEAYRRQGRWALWLYGAVVVGTMLTVEAVVALATSGLAINIFHLPNEPVLVSAVLILAAILILRKGNFSILDKVTKVLVGVFTICTFVATVMVIPRINWGNSWWPELIGEGGVPNWLVIDFTVALVGWMPAPVDLSVWHSIWAVAKQKSMKTAPSLSLTRIDFHIGYIITTILAVCFMIMGAGVIFGSGEPMANSAGAFAAQVVSLYVETLGPILGGVVGLSAFAVMLSTLLTVVDGYPRAIASLLTRFEGPEDPTKDESLSAAYGRKFQVGIVLIALGAFIIQYFFLKSFKTFVDVATMLSFVTAPVCAWLNHRAMHSADVAAEFRPSAGSRILSLMCIGFLSLFALVYLYRLICVA